MRLDTRLDMRLDTSVDMRLDMRLDTSVDTNVDTSVDTRLDKSVEQSVEQRTESGLEWSMLEHSEGDKHGECGVATYRHCPHANNRQWTQHHVFIEQVRDVRLHFVQDRKGSNQPLFATL